MLALVVWALASRLLRMLIHATPLQPIDRVLGAGFGLLRGAVLLLALATVVGADAGGQVAGMAAFAGRAVAGVALQGLKPVLPPDIAQLPAGLTARAAEPRTPTMCGIVGVISKAPVNQLIYDALLLLQHRGQDAAGIVTMQGTKCFMHKARGMVRDVFRTRNMRALPGNVGLGQVRYPTAGNAYSEEEAQPFYVNAPFGIVLVHNGNLTNAHALKSELFDIDRRHINTESDTEVLINVLAHEIERRRARPAADARRRSSRPWPRCTGASRARTR